MLGHVVGHHSICLDVIQLYGHDLIVGVFMVLLLFVNTCILAQSMHPETQHAAWLFRIVDQGADPAIKNFGTFSSLFSAFVP